MINQGIYGEYNIEVVKGDTGESEYPFGTGYQKNVILDEFFSKVLSGWRHSPQAWMQTCITNTGNIPATRFDTTGTFGVPNDTTWASTTFYTNINTGENKISMSRDFIFDPVSDSSKIYREAMVGLFYKDRSNYSANIESDIAVSHFVFPTGVMVLQNDRLKINYALNFILEYLSPTGAPFNLNGDGYNFGGQLKLMSNDVGIFSSIPTTNTWFSIDQVNFGTSNTNLQKQILSNTNSYAINSANSFLYTPSFLGGIRPTYNRVGFYGSSFSPSVYPNRYNGVTISGTAASLSSSNFQINENGASIDVNYYFSPSTGNRNVSGIVLTNTSATNNFSVVYLQFNTGQTILANDPISMRLQWYLKRL